MIEPGLAAWFFCAVLWAIALALPGSPASMALPALPTQVVIEDPAPPAPEPAPAPAPSPPTAYEPKPPPIRVPDWVPRGVVNCAGQTGENFGPCPGWTHSGDPNQSGGEGAGGSAGAAGSGSGGAGGGGGHGGGHGK